MPMNALSRREEETLLKAAKTRALKECDPVVKGAYIS
jgi:COX assembly protein 1